MINFADLKIQMRGSELPFLRYAGMSEHQLSGKHQPCECCGGSDCYRTDKKAGNGSFFCGQAGGGTTGGDWIDNLCHTKSMNASEVYGIACEFLGISEMDDSKRVELQARLAMERKQAEAKTKLKDDNAYFDFHVEAELDELIFLMKGRETPAIDDQERRQAAKVIAMLNKRYATNTATRPVAIEIPSEILEVFKAGLQAEAHEKRTENMDVAA